MSSFKDYLASDLDIIFNPDEFGELHDVDGRQLLVVLDNDRLSHRTQKEYEGIYVGDLLFFVSAANYGTRPKPGEIVRFDGEPYEVFDAKEDSGVYEIILKGSAS